MNSLEQKTTDMITLRKRETLAFFVLLSLITIGAGIVTEFSVARSFTAIPIAFRWMITNIIPNERALTRLPTILEKLTETLFTSVIATMSAGIVSFFLALLASKTTRVSGVLSIASRGLSSFLRNIPIAAWAMIFLFSFGQTTFTGFLALFFTTLGFLTRVFIEAIDEASSDSVEALRAVGGSYFHTIFQAVLPASLPQLISWVLFMVETNIRSATLVGLLTGTGIGFTFQLYYRSLNYPAAGLVIFLLVIVVLIIEWISNQIRKVIL
jgi:phosphonate transport system permease protein